MTFAGVPRASDWLADDDEKLDVGIIGAPFDHGTTGKPGTRYGPDHIRRSDYLPDDVRRPEVNSGVDPFDALDVADFGDMEAAVGYMDIMVDVVHKFVRDAYNHADKVIVLGGDHSISHGTISGCVDALGGVDVADDIAVVHFDAHADTGKSHMGKTHGTPMRWLIEAGYVKPENFYQIGLRGYWPEQSTFEWMSEQGMKWRTMKEIDELGIHEVCRALVNDIGNKKVWLSIDIDVADPATAPGTGTAEPGGMTARELLWSTYYFAGRLDIIGGEVVEVNPMLDPSGITGILANRVVLEMLRGIYQQQKLLYRL